VKGVIQDEESDDVEAEFLQGQTLTTDEIETDPMKKLKKIKLLRHRKNIGQIISSLIYQCIKPQMFKDLKT
jgi:GMP synthase PP-ATPase subunit